MKNILISSLLLFSLYAENNETQKENNSSNEQNISTVSDIKEDKIKKQLKVQMEREKKFAEEKTFYQGKDYDLSYAEIDKSSLDNIKLPEPDYDFNMDDVYD